MTRPIKNRISCCMVSCDEPWQAGRKDIFQGKYKSILVEKESYLLLKERIQKDTGLRNNMQELTAIINRV